VGPAADPGNIDIVLLSHDQHHDNLDDLRRKFVETVFLTLITVAGYRRLQNGVKGLQPWKSHIIEAFDILGIGLIFKV
jgi:hypothetical protein